VLIGGLSDKGECLPDILFYNTKKKLYDPISVQVPMGFAISRHVSGLIDDKIYIFGGRKAPFSPKTNDLYVLDLKSLTLTQIPTNFTFPAPRSDHAGTAIGNRFFIYGGSDQNTNPLNDLYFYDTIASLWYRVDPNPIPIITKVCNIVTQNWQEIQTIGAPTPRSAMRMVAIDKKLYVFGGGIRSLGIKCVAKTNDLHVFNTETLTWERLNPEGSEIDLSSFSCVCPINNYIFIGVGSSITNSYVSSSCYIYDTSSNEIFQIPSKTEARDGSACALIGDELYLFGGQYVRTIETLTLKFMTPTPKNIRMTL
jgi:N-acetylneuraminic acid mutarotase